MFGLCSLLFFINYAEMYLFIKINEMSWAFT